MSSSIRTIIIDDHQPSVTILAEELKSFPDIQIAATALTSTKGEEIILKHKPELLFLDIELPDTTGLDFLARLNNKINWKLSVVFYTSYEKYLLQALRLQAFDFLLKPLDKNELKLVMNRFYRNKNSLEKTFPMLPSIPVDKLLSITTVTNDKIILRPQNVGYFKYNSEYKLWEIVLDNFQHLILKHHTTAEVILNYGSEFIQIHKTFIINIHYLGMIQENTCIMLYPFNSVTELKISKIYKKTLLKKFYNL